MSPTELKVLYLWTIKAIPKEKSFPALHNAVI
jgi:hypothetical protein